MTSKEFENFDQTMRKLVTVQHDEVKAKLDAEKREKQKRKAKKNHSASEGRASSEKG
ncbi:MAG TPA: hypothetical protein VIW68_07315 [Candidatus Sulfotelmatobacter sp.]